MNKVNIRPRLRMTAFQWDGGPVEGCEVIPYILFDEDRAEFKLELNNNGHLTYALKGDWVVSNGGGRRFAWPAETFAETYEVIEE